MFTKIIKYFSLLLLILLLSGCAVCVVHGTANSNALGAKVFVNGKHVQTIKSAGHIEIKFYHKGKNIIEIVKEGYKTYKTEIFIKSGEDYLAEEIILIESE